jgi:diadenosine tetraphosphate (Ap4A) HIT family hydrolase
MQVFDSSSPSGRSIRNTIGAYDACAAAYSEKWFQSRAMESALGRFLSMVPARSGVLDLGCGSGRDVRFLLDRGVEVVGIDLSLAMLAEASRRVPQGVFRRMNIREPAYPPGTVGGLWNCASWHHLSRSDAARALGKYFELLIPGGVLGLSTREGSGDLVDGSGRFFAMYERSQLTDMLTGAGFRIAFESVTAATDESGANPKKGAWLFIIAAKPADAHSHDSESPEQCDCRLCPEERFSYSRLAGLPTFSSILWGDEHLYVIPDLAPLVEGHLLLVSSRHYINYGASPVQLGRRIAKQQKRLVSLFRSAFDRPTLFLEHGPAFRGRAGSCIDHAHLHCLPIDSSQFLDGLVAVLGRGMRASLPTIRRLHRARKSYAFVQPGAEPGRVYEAEVLPQQFFRQAVVNVHGGRDWRWQDTFRTESSIRSYLRTTQVLRPLCDELPAGDGGRE